MRHQTLNVFDTKEAVFIWEEQHIGPFNELIISWDAKRPTNGEYCIQISLFTTEWSSWLNYAVWGKEKQYTFHQQSQNAIVQVFQDTIFLLKGHLATGFKIRIAAKNGASLQEMKVLHACATNLDTHKVESTITQCNFAPLDVPKLSQMALKDDRNMRICSPTSVTSVIRYLSNSEILQPLSFADKVFDSAFDIYGNWIFNTAEASHELGMSWSCYVDRLSSFDQILQQLSKGFPVVVSIQGSLPGSLIPYDSGHLLVIRGYNQKTRDVLCMDPAFPTDECTYVEYKLENFMKAWNNRQGLAYLFEV